MKRSWFAKFFQRIILFSTLLLLLTLSVFVFVIPKVAENIFGPASSSHHIIEKIYWSSIILHKKNTLISPNSALGGDTHFRVDLGENAFSVGKRLDELGLIDDQDAFRIYLIYSGLDTKIQAGNYILNPQMTPLQIAKEIQDATPDFVNFIVLAGWRSEEIALSLQYSGLDISTEEFLEQTRFQGAEGYLFPSEYELPRDATAEKVVKIFQVAFNQSITEEMETGYRRQGLSNHEAVILASIIERETIMEDEMPFVASVFLNRLISGMLLNADPTVQFALGYNASQDTWWTNPLSSKNLAINSPYNTYLYPGLPPGPICNPGIAALKSVAFPAETPYYYFRVSCDDPNRHAFSKTLEEHINNACP